MSSRLEVDLLKNQVHLGPIVHVPIADLRNVEILKVEPVVSDLITPFVRIGTILGWYVTLHIVQVIHILWLPSNGIILVYRLKHGKCSVVQSVHV